MAEFYSANLANEIKKGMGAEGEAGRLSGAPLGYLNVHEVVGGRQVARIMPDPERAALRVGGVFELYVTGEWTIERLAAGVAHTRPCEPRPRRRTRKSRSVSSAVA